MIEKQEVKVPERTAVETVAVTCDVCKTRHTAARSNFNEGIAWNEGYDSSETTVALKSSSGGQYGGHGQVEQYHVCRACFVTHLVPFLKGLGAEPTSYQFDW